MSEKLTDEEFIALARKACRNSIMNTATGAYLDEALQRLDQATELIDKISDELARKAQVNSGSAAIFRTDNPWSETRRQDLLDD